MFKMTAPAARAWVDGVQRRINPMISSNLRSTAASRSSLSGAAAVSPSALAVDPQPPFRLSHDQNEEYGLFLARLNPAGTSLISISHFSQIFVII